MPLYEYNCSKCKQEFELLVLGNQKPRCPNCGNEKIERQMSVPAGHIKTSGAGHCIPSASNCGGSSCCHGCPGN